jgi:hypothetical protein
MEQQAFVDGYLTILTEALEGPQQRDWSIFIDQGTGLLQTLASLSAAQASQPSKPGQTTIVAHSEHTRVHLAGMNAFLRGEDPKVDWAASWRITELDEAGWRKLQDDLSHEYQTFRRFFEQHDDWDARAVSGAIGLLAHVCYHLGAIRQMVKSVRQGQA